MFFFVCFGIGNIYLLIFVFLRKITSAVKQTFNEQCTDKNYANDEYDDGT